MFAEELATLYLEKLGVTNFPVPVELLPKLIGVEPVFDDLGSVVGGIYSCIDNVKFISISTRLREPEKRHVIAHECAHAILHHPFQSLSRTDCSLEEVIRDKQEYQAELFAAYFLIPKWAEFNEYLPIWEIADMFCVPDELLQFRLEHEKNQALSYFFSPWTSYLKKEAIKWSKK